MVAVVCVGCWGGGAGGRGFGLKFGICVGGNVIPVTAGFFLLYLALQHPPAVSLPQGSAQQGAELASLPLLITGDPLREQHDIWQPGDTANGSAGVTQLPNLSKSQTLLS